MKAARAGGSGAAKLGREEAPDGEQPSRVEAAYTRAAADLVGRRRLGLAAVWWSRAGWWRWLGLEESHQGRQQVEGRRLELQRGRIERWQRRPDLVEGRSYGEAALQQLGSKAATRR